ncbi:MAG: GntR family transcriptional regulator [Planctomycetales bacterium]|nr:GntR family transcriptional regulator [Planctomycetales bacterium]
MNTLAIDPKSRLPLHVQVEQMLRELISEAKYQQGELLPDEMTLAAQLGISRGTVRSAIGRLVSEGLLQRRPGVGTRAIQQPAESALVAWRSLTREMAAKGILVETYHLDCQKRPASKAAAAALMIQPGTLLFRLDRLRGWEGAPVLHSRSWFHPRLKLSGNEDFRQPLYEVLEKVTGVVADGAREELLAVEAKSRMSKLLDVKPGSPLLLRRHVVHDAGKRPFEFAEVHYVSARYSLTIDLQKDSS